MLAALLALFSTLYKAMSAKQAERSFIMVKPDGVQRGLVGEIIKRFEQRGYTLRGMKMMWVRIKIQPDIYTMTRFRGHIGLVLNVRVNKRTCP